MSDEKEHYDHRIQHLALFDKNGCGKKCWEVLSKDHSIHDYHNGILINNTNGVLLGFDMTLDQLIAKIGIPEYVLFDFGVDGFTNHFRAETKLYYPKFGYIIVLLHSEQIRTPEEWEIEPSVEVCLSPSLRLQTILIKKPGTIIELLANPGSVSQGFPEHYAKLLVPWNGYKCITVAMPSDWAVRQMLIDEGNPNYLSA